MRRTGWGVLALLGVLVLAGQPAFAQTETTEVRIGHVPGTCNLAHYVMKEKQLVEKYLKEAGLGSTKVTYSVFTGAGQLVDALISSNMDFGALGATQSFVLVDKTAATDNPFRVAAPLCDQTFVLMTSNDRIKSVRDFKAGDRIAMPTPKNSVYAQVLQIYAAKEMGWDKRTFFDDMGIPMGHPEGVAALKAKDPTVTAHFTGAPWSLIEAKNGAREVLSSFDVTGPATLVTQTVSKKWKDANPKSYAAVVAAFEEATKTIDGDKRYATDVISRNEKLAGINTQELEEWISNPKQMVYTTTPHGTEVWTGFMRKAGILRRDTASWKDFYWDNNHAKLGN